MKKILTALVVAASMGMTGSVFAQDYTKGMDAYYAQNYATAVKEFSFLADRGHVDAASILATMYEVGRGVKQDYKEAAKWHRKGAEHGDKHAQYFLGQAYQKGQGVIQDYKEALVWYHKAAEQGYTDAHERIGAAHAYGLGVTQDKVYAHMWYNIAASYGSYNGPQWRDDIAKTMTATEIVKAQELARECVKKQYKGC